MRARWFLVLAAATLLGSAPLGAATEPLRLETPTKIDAVKVADVDGDSIVDVVTLSGRTVCVWTAGKDALPTSEPRWRVDLPADVSFIDVARVSRPALLCIGGTGTHRLRLDRTGPQATEPIAAAVPLGWRDGTKAVFADLHPGPASNPTCVVPAKSGWRLEPSWHPDRSVMPVPQRSEVIASGPFLEDVASVKSGPPALRTAEKNVPKILGPGGARPIALLWGLAEDALVVHAGQSANLEPMRIDLSFLPGTGERRISDLDGNGTPDLIHRDGDNREGKYAFFRVPPPEKWKSKTADPVWGPGSDLVPPDLRPPAAFLRLSGFNLDPDYVDLDGDGLVDFVVTTIAVDGPNTLRAVASGKVTATTLAFLQRKPAPDAPMFPTQPDATVTSDIGVRIRFGFTGTIDVTRSFTILASGDLDGDGRRDLVIRSGPATLQVRKGTAAGVWSKEATAVAIPPVGPGEECEPTAANLDGRPGDEVLLLYRGAESAPDRLYILKP